MLKVPIDNEVEEILFEIAAPVEVVLVILGLVVAVFDADEPTVIKLVVIASSVVSMVLANVDVLVVVDIWLVVVLIKVFV